MCDLIECKVRESLQSVADCFCDSDLTTTCVWLTLQRPPGIVSILDDVCATMHGQSEGADLKLLQVGVSLWRVGVVLQKMGVVL